MIQLGPELWKRITLDDRETAVLTCPKCGNSAALDHEIDSGGRVTPSVQCPFRGCDFHEHVQLIGWNQ